MTWVLVFDMEADDNTELLKVLEQSRNLLNLVGEDSSKTRLDSPLLTPFGSYLQKREQEGGRGEGKEGKGEGEEGSVSLDKRKSEEAGEGHHFLEQKGKLNLNIRG